MILGNPYLPGTCLGVCGRWPSVILLLSITCSVLFRRPLGKFGKRLITNVYGQGLAQDEVWHAEKHRVERTKEDMKPVWRKARKSVKASVRSPSKAKASWGLSLCFGIP